MPEQITFYTNQTCPFAHRTAIALAEAKAEFTPYEVDLTNKPSWYAPQVNPASKVPAIAYGGPRVNPETPSPESVKLAESLVLVEFVADLFPASGLLPSDPVARARARFFIDVVSNKFVPGAFGLWFRGEGSDGFFAAVEALQALLPADGPYALGKEFTIADIAIASFVTRLDLIIREDIGKFAAGEGPQVYKALQEPKYARFFKYYQAILDRPSVKATFDADLHRPKYIERFVATRVQAAA